MIKNNWIYLIYNLPSLGQLWFSELYIESILIICLNWRFFKLQLDQGITRNILDEW